MAVSDMGPNDTGGDDGAGQSVDERAHERRELRVSRIGMVLIVVGAIALLSNLGAFQGLGNVFGMVIFAGLGVWALSHYLRRRRIGSLIGAFVLFGLAAATVGGAAAGFYFLGLIGVGFAAVYYVDRERWWAIIPAGTLLSLAVVAGLSGWAPGYDATWVLFVGLALTFGVLYVLPGAARSWAIYPALAFLVLAVLGFTVSGTWLVPIALVVIGLYMLLRQNAERGRGVVTSGPTGPGADRSGAAGAPTGGRGDVAGTAGTGAAGAPTAPTDGPSTPEGESGSGDEGQRRDD